MTTTFETLWVLGKAPDWATPGTIAFVASRPLYGTERAITPTRWAGEVSVHLDDPDAQKYVQLNKQLDARVAIWTTREELIIQTRHRLIREYGADCLAGISDDDVWGMVPPRPEPVTI